MSATQGPLVILANHQHAALSAALNALLPSARIASFDVAGLARDPSARRQAAEAIDQAAHVISQDVPPAYGPFCTAALRAARRPVVLLPAFQFSGFHPDSVTIDFDGVAVEGATGTWHSRIALAAFLAGLPAAEAASLFNSLVYARLGYYTAFAAERARLVHVFGTYGFDIAACVDAWPARGCFMIDPTRPRMRVWLDLARLLCARMGRTVENGDAREDAVPNPLAMAPTHPVFADIAARIGVSPEGNFRGRMRKDGRPTMYNLEDFLAASFEAFARVPLVVLRAADGMDGALPALGLSEADFGRAEMRRHDQASSSEEAVLLTWQGRLVSREVASTTLVQAPVWPASADSTPAGVELPALPVVQPVTIALAGGLLATPAARGCVTLTQPDRRLIAPRHLVTLRFAAQAPADSDLFLPISRADLACLRALLGGAWRLPNGEALPAGGVCIGPGFVLVVGPHRVDLTSARLSRHGPAGAPTRIFIETPEQTVELAQDGDAVPASQLLGTQEGDPETVPVAASLEQFRASPGWRLRLHGAPEMIHLPLAVDDRTRRWMHGASPEAAPRLGRNELRLTVMRAANKFVRLDRGAEGVIFDAKAIWARQGHKAAPVRREAAARAPKIEVPVCVFPAPIVADFYRFFAEAALGLHILQPILPPGTHLLLPGEPAQAGGFDPAAALADLGLGGLPTVRVRSPLARLADVTWLQQDSISSIPATMVQAFRARVHALHKPAPTRRRLFLTPAEGPRLAWPGPIESFLSARGFETICLANGATRAAIAAFGAAEFIVAPRQAALAGLLFCQAGTRVLELAADDAFRPEFWQISEKLGLLHAVLPCETVGGTSATDLLVDDGQFRALFRMLRHMEA